MATKAERSRGVSQGIADSLARAKATMDVMEEPREPAPATRAIVGVSEPYLDRSLDRLKEKPWHTAPSRT